MDSVYWIRRESFHRHVVMVRETAGGDRPDYDFRARTTEHAVVRFEGWPAQTRQQAYEYIAAHQLPAIADPYARPDMCEACEGTGIDDDGRHGCGACFGTGSNRFASAHA